ncbi:MAG TPA: WhiB family transcriptional regulator [Demequina sp.]|nr:WhiB family transcriptional regulator [Demequina sp.]
MSTLIGGRCAEVDPAVWFPEKGQTNTAAKAICHRCDIEAACLAAAIADPELEGVWGGTSQRERQALRGSSLPRIRPINHGTEGGYMTHLRRGEPACPVCRDATTSAHRRRRAERVA